MAAKEKKSTIAKHLKESQGVKEKAVESPKSKRGRKNLLLNDTKSSSEENSPKILPRRKRGKNEEEDGRSIPLTKRLRRNGTELENSRTPPHGSQKVKKAHLEKELGDLLENATGRNTPSLSRGKKGNDREREEESEESVEEKSLLLLSKAKKVNDKETDDDNASVKSFSTSARAKKLVDKEVEDDVLSVKSMTIKSKKNEGDEDAASVRSLIRPNLVAKSNRKKKSVLTAIAVKKKIFIRRGRPRKTKEINDQKSKNFEDKKVGRLKVVDKNLGDSKQKRIIKKPLKFQTKIKDQTRIRPTLSIKNQKLKKAKLKLSEKNQGSRHKVETEVSKDATTDGTLKERLKADNQTMTKSDTSDLTKNVTPDGTSKKKKYLSRKRKLVKKDGPEIEGTVKSSDIYFFAEGEAGALQESTIKGKSKIIKLSQGKSKGSKKKTVEVKKQRRESGIHFETTRSPDDSSVIIVQPRLGPKIKGTKRLKPILPKSEEINKRAKNASKEMVPMLPNSLPNFNQISGSYFVQKIPNNYVFTTNSALIKSYSSQIGMKGNFDPSLPVNKELSYAENSNFPVASFRPKVSSNEIIVTPSGIVLSGSRLVSPPSQNSTMCFSGSGAKFVSDPSNKEVVFSPREGLDNIPAPGLIYQSSATLIRPQSCTSSNPTIFFKRPETMSTSLISTASGALLISPSVSSNGGPRVNNVKSHSDCVSSPDIIASEKALEGDFQGSEEASGTNRFKSKSKIDFIPSIPVAKSVNDLIMLKKKSSTESRGTGKVLKKNVVDSSNESLGKLMCDVPKILRQTDSVKSRVDRMEQKNTRKRTLKNVRHLSGSDSELTYSEPEFSCCENDAVSLSKTISCEHIDKFSRIPEPKSTVLLQLGSEPIILSESLAPFETASMLLVAKKEKLEEKLEKEGDTTRETSPKIKGAIDVCRFSKENEEALKEFGLDSDLDQTKSENDGDSPIKTGKLEDHESDVFEVSKKARIKEEVDNVLKEMPIRKIPNFYRKTESLRTCGNRGDFKSPLIHKNTDYLSVSPSKPPTVIDKLLERNKSLKKAEEEGKMGNAIRNLNENSLGYEVAQVKKRNQHEGKSRKFNRAIESRRGSHKRLIPGNTITKVCERRGSNPEIYSNNHVKVNSQISNENVPLKRAANAEDETFSRRGSIDYESVHKVLDRRCSLPVPVEEFTDSKLSKSTDGVNKIKTDNIKTIIVGSNKPLTNKNRVSEGQPRVINIVTSNNGLKKGKNLMEEVGLEIVSSEKNFLNGGTNDRRVSLESSNSESENLQNLINGLTNLHNEEKMPHKVPYFEEESRKRVDKVRLSVDRKSLDGKEKKTTLIEESPEDLVTKETILSALGLRSLKAAAQSSQKKKENQNQSTCPSDNGGYTGTLKAVIKIQRQEKKGSSKSPVKMVYKASSSTSAGVQVDELNNFDEAEATSLEDAEENNTEESKNGNGKAKSLVIPEKASSFSIHPGRMCSDVCTYCFGKFGLLDTPCHIAQLKDVDKRRNILATEVHLTADSCLCDACFRHVDKKSNCPAFTDKKNDIKKKSVRKQSCVVQNCNADSHHSIRRKLFLKLKKSIGRKVVLDAGKLEKLQQGQFLPFCNRHIYWIDYFMSCGICKKRLKSVNMYRVTSEVLELNAALSSDEIPAILTENRFLCKICNCFASIRIKCKNPDEMSSGHRQFYENCRKRILKCHGMDVLDSEPEGDCKGGERKSLRRTKKSSKPTATVTNENSKSDNDVDMSTDEIDKIKHSEKSEKELKEVSHLNIPPKANGNLDFGGVSITPTTTEVNPTQIHVKLGNLNIGALGNLNIGQDVRHGARPGDMQCFPTETELALRAHFDLKPSAEDESAKTPRKGFEKCTTTIQFSTETKNLFYNLQMPYGNQSSFFRHLILLEKYFRSGDLVISRNADPKAINYISSVQNRIRSYEGVHSPVKKAQDISPSLSILPQPIKTESRNSAQEPKASVLPSRPFTLTPMPANSYSNFLKNSPLSQIQATVQNIQPVSQNQTQGIMTSLLKSSVQPGSKYASHPKPEVSITSVPSDGNPTPVRVGQAGKASVLTKKIQENLRNLASKSHGKQTNQARAVILNRTVAGQKQSLVQVTTGGKTIHLTLSQFRRIQQMQMRKKQYLEHQAKMLKGREDQGKVKSKSVDEGFLKNLSPELEIQEVKPKGTDSEVFPLISEVRSLAGEEANWDKRSDSEESTPTDSFPKIPKTLSVSVTKIPLPDYSGKEQSLETVE